MGPCQSSPDAGSDALPTRACPCPLQDVAQRAAFFDAAIARLRNSADFARADASCLVSLGDAFMAKAELLAGPVLSPGAWSEFSRCGEGRAPLMCASSPGAV